MAQRKVTPVSAVPTLDGSVGDPAAYSDPNSNASMALRIQAMGDQLKADGEFDTPPASRVEKFQDMTGDVISVRVPDGPNCYRPNRNSVNAEACGLGLPPPRTWIQQQMVCQKPEPSMELLEGYADAGLPGPDPVVTYAVVAAGAALLLCVFIGMK